jgi:hypothetical protein
MRNEEPKGKKKPKVIIARYIKKGKRNISSKNKNKNQDANSEELAAISSSTESSGDSGKE